MRRMLSTTQTEHMMTEPIREYDKNGKLIYSKASDGHESWHERDANGNFIYSKICHLGRVILEEWWEYDGQSRCVHYKNSKGTEEWWEYDGQSRCVHYKNSKGTEEWWEYDVSGKLVFYKNGTSMTDTEEKLAHYILKLETELSLLRNDNETLRIERDRAERILATLREPSEGMQKAAMDEYWCPVRGGRKVWIRVIRAAVAAAEQEVGNE